MTKQKSRRLKTVFQNKYDCIDRFSDQSQDFGVYKCKSRRGADLTPVYFHGSTLYSYGSHYVLAQVTQLNGLKVAAVNFSKYSSSTTEQSWAALSSLNKAGFVVVKVDLCSDGPLSVYGAIRDSLQKESERLTETIFTAQFEPNPCLKYLLKDAQKHNLLCEKLGLLEFKIDLCQETVRHADNLMRLHLKAAQDFDSRKQTWFYEPASHRDKHKANRKTA